MNKKYLLILLFVFFLLNSACTKSEGDSQSTNAGMNLDEFEEFFNEEVGVIDESDIQEENEEDDDNEENEENEENDEQDDDQNLNQDSNDNQDESESQVNNNTTEQNTTNQTTTNQTTRNGEKLYLISEYGNFTALYNTYIKENINKLANSNEGKNEVISIRWTTGNEAEVLYNSAGENILALITVAYRDGLVYVNSFKEIEIEEENNQEEEIDNEEENNQNDIEEENNQNDIEEENEEENEIESDNSSDTRTNVNVSNYIENGSINFTKMYGEFILNNINSIVNDGGNYQVKNIRWTGGTVAEISFTDGDKNFLAEIEFSFKNSYINVESFKINSN
ncbi:hypothetical protein [Candidatus Vampirococcus lugosii]|uniref:Lipoprotein n=1 Tax=Candidatus Vampirococcus lugosii TaxID=2789015 RepID=A0ABS5QPH7_9BACT|nr:hypothetical protein [Candidatus Vampirococcus lugosii]MBS8122451.1 hypothetical protein [Candidatus Vampirococcus lugosii]